MLSSINAIISKAIKVKSVPLIRYLSRRGLHNDQCRNDLVGSANPAYFHCLKLPIPKNKVLATYVWIDGTGIKLRSKDRVLNKEPCDLKALPNWSFDGSSTGQAKAENSDVILIPAAMYQDPFRMSPHVIVLCETMHADGKPTATNHRSECAKILSSIGDQDPWFGIEQEYTMFNKENWPLGWPGPRGFPVIKDKYSYCGVGNHVAGREIVECHTRASLYSGMDFEGTNAEVMMGAWEFQVGTAMGIKAADDLWIGRYLLERIAENFGVIISYHPKPMGDDHPGIGCHHNFSIKKMRDDGGIAEIEKVCKVLCENHVKDMPHYGLDDASSRKRLSGKFESSSFDTCKWGIADRTASIRLQRNVAISKKGFLEDRRPAGDCDPYKVCVRLAQACK